MCGNIFHIEVIWFTWKVANIFFIRTKKDLIFARVNEVQGSDFLVTPTNDTKEVRLPKQRLILLPKRTPFELVEAESELVKE